MTVRQIQKENFDVLMAKKLKQDTNNYKKYKCQKKDREKTQ